MFVLVSLFSHAHLCSYVHCVHALLVGTRRVEIVTSLPRMQPQTQQTHPLYEPVQSFTSNEKWAATHQLYDKDSYALDDNKDSPAAATTDTYEHDAHDDSSTLHKVYNGSCSSVSSSVVSSIARQQPDAVTSHKAVTERCIPTTDTTAAVEVTAVPKANDTTDVEACSSSTEKDTAIRHAQDTESLLLPLPPLTEQQSLDNTRTGDAIYSGSGSVTPPRAVSAEAANKLLSSDVAGTDVHATDSDDAHTSTSTPRRHIQTVAVCSSDATSTVPNSNTTAASANSISNRPAAVHSSDAMPVIAVHSDSLRCHTHTTNATVDTPALNHTALLPASAFVAVGKSDDTWLTTGVNQQQQQQQQQHSTTQQQTNSQRLSRAMALAAGVLRMAQNHYQHTAATATADSTAASAANRCK
jgi:hypothetical protein